MHVRQDLNNNQAAALVAAGRLLQSKAWSGGGIPVTRAPGETYPQAVARVVAALDTADRDRLRELVAWVMGYERQEATI